MYATTIAVPKRNRVCSVAKTNSGLKATLAATLVGSITSKIAITATKIGTGTTPIRLVVLGEIKLSSPATGRGWRFGRMTSFQTLSLWLLLMFGFCERVVPSSGDFLSQRPARGTRHDPLIS